MEPRSVLTADDIVRAGACRDGVERVARRLADRISAAMTPAALMAMLAPDEQPYVLRAAGLDGDSKAGAYGDGDSGYGDSGYGYGDGDSGYGYGYGYGDGDSYGNGYGDGYGNGYGDGYGGSYGGDNQEDEE